MPIIVDKFHTGEIFARLSNLVSEYGTDEILNTLSEMGIRIHLPSDTGTGFHGTVGTAVRQFLTSQHFAEFAATTQRTYKTEISVLTKYCKNSLPDGLESSAVLILSRQFLAAYLSTCTNQYTRNKRVSFLRTFIQTVYGKESLRDLSRTLKCEPIVDPTPKAYRIEQVESLLLEVRKTRNGLRDHALIWTLLGSGIRLDELLQLKISDISVDEGTLWIRPKGRKGVREERHILPQALDVLLHYLDFQYGPSFAEAHGTRYIFSANGGVGPLCPRAVELMVKRIQKRCTATIADGERDNLNVHSFRHTFALLLLTSGVSIYTISKLLGHRSVQTTEVYLRLFNQDLKDAIAKHPLAKISVSYLRSLEVSHETEYRN